MPCLKPLLLVFGLVLGLAVRAETITVAAASDLKFALDEIIAAFQSEHPEHRVQVVYGSSGKFHTQIQQGAPYDLYFSADIAYPRALAAKGFAASEVTPYAVGRLVIWSTRRDAGPMTLAGLADPHIKRIAIANPKHAPYGMRTREALRSAKLWAQLEPKLVYGESVSHAAQFAQTGNAQVGVIALSLALSPELKRAGHYWSIPDELHSSLEQGFIITRRAADSALAERFADYMGDHATREILARYGFCANTLDANAQGSDGC